MKPYKSITTLLKEVKAPKMLAAHRKKAVTAVQKVLKPIYFDRIPINEIADALAKVGVVILQEDNTEWSGIFVGSSGNVTLALGPIESGEKVNGIMTYQSYSNVMLALQWYKESPRKKFEINGYIT